MNKKIYKGYELVKAIEDGEIKEGTILIFTSTISKDNKKEVEVVRRPEGLILYKKDAAEILPTSWLFNSKIEILEDNTEQIEEILKLYEKQKDKIKKAIDFINDDNNFFEDGENWKNVLKIKEILEEEN